MPGISFEESLDQIGQLSEQADSARGAGEWQKAIDAFRELLDHPCAHHQVDDFEVLDDIHQILRSAGRYDEAIAAKREAIEAGYRSSPDPEADIAECLVEAGRRDEADASYAELRARDPDDVWLYNSAGYIYAGVDDREALRWCLDGIEVAIATGDPEQVVDQLLDMTQRQWDALGEPHDETLIARVDAFMKTWKPVPRPHRWGDAPPTEDRRCDHCGYDPEALRRDARPGRSLGRSPVRSPVRPSSNAALSLAWFPADDWAVAVERWPDLLDELPAEHLAYSHRIEARLKWAARNAPGRRLHVAPLSVEELDAGEGDDAGSGEARSRLAARMAQEGRAMAWPLGRNERCWCGSGRKYKQCCGPVPAAEDQP